MRRILYALLIAGSQIAAPVDAAPAADLAAALKSLAADDMRLLSIGYRLAVSNAAYCREVQPAAGLLLLDVRGFDRPAELRVALGLTGDFAVQAVVTGSPADRAGVVPGAEVVAVGAQQLAALPAEPVHDFARLAAVQDRIDATLMVQGRVALGLAGAAVEFGGVAACRSRFELLTGGKGAAADGRRVQVSRTLLGMTDSDDEAAFVIAHELAHNVLAHPSARGRKASDIRKTERGADRLALWLMANAGFDPLAAPGFLRRWGKRGLAALLPAPTHDRAETRARLVGQEMSVLSLTKVEANGLRDWRNRFTPGQASRQKSP